MDMAGDSWKRLITVIYSFKIGVKMDPTELIMVLTIFYIITSLAYITIIILYVDKKFKDSLDELEEISNKMKTTGQTLQSRVERATDSAINRVTQAFSGGNNELISAIPSLITAFKELRQQNVPQTQQPATPEQLKAYQEQLKQEMAAVEAELSKKEKV